MRAAASFTAAIASSAPSSSPAFSLVSTAPTIQSQVPCRFATDRGNFARPRASPLQRQAWLALRADRSASSTRQSRSEDRSGWWSVLATAPWHALRSKDEDADEDGFDVWCMAAPPLCAGTRASRIAEGRACRANHTAAQSSERGLAAQETTERLCAKRQHEGSRGRARRTRFFGVISDGMVCVHTRYPRRSRASARVTSNDEWRIEPAGQAAPSCCGRVVTARQHGHTRAGVRGRSSTTSGQRAAGVTRHDDVGWRNRDRVERHVREVRRDAKTGPFGERAPCEGGRNDGGSAVSTASAEGEVSSSRPHDVPLHARRPREVDDPPRLRTAADAAGASPSLPYRELIARQAARVAHGHAQMGRRATRQEASEIAVREPAFEFRAKTSRAGSRCRG